MQNGPVPFRNRQEWGPVYPKINIIIELLGEESNTADEMSFAVEIFFEHFIAIIPVFPIRNTR